jgi:ribosomal protein L37AE/L43A
MECPSCGSADVTPSGAGDGYWNCMECNHRWKAY